MLKLVSNDEARGKSKTHGDLYRDEIERALEDQILGGVLKPGDRIDERALAERFSVSRSPVRDAIGRLASVGLIDVVPRSGSYVARLNISEILHIFEFLTDLEGLCAYHAAQRMELDEQKALAKLAEQFAGDVDQSPDGYALVNYAFHDAIYSAAKNPYLESVTRQARRRVSIYRSRTFRLPGRINRSAEEHVEIGRAITSGNAELARDLIMQHVDIKKRDFAPLIAMLSQQA